MAFGLETNKTNKIQHCLYISCWHCCLCRHRQYTIRNGFNIEWRNIEYPTETSTSSGIIMAKIDSLIILLRRKICDLCGEHFRMTFRWTIKWWFCCVRLIFPTLFSQIIIYQSSKQNATGHHFRWISTVG